MIYSVAENLRWWESLTRQDRTDLIENIKEVAYAPMVLEWIARIDRQHTLGICQPSTIDLVKLRKWAK